MRWRKELIGSKKLTKRDVMFLAGQTTEHNISSTEGHSWKFSTHSGEAHRECTECKIQEFSYDNKDWHPLVSTNFTTEQIDEWLTKGTITLLVYKRVPIGVELN